MFDTSNVICSLDDVHQITLALPDSNLQCLLKYSSPCYQNDRHSTWSHRSQLQATPFMVHCANSRYVITLLLHTILTLMVATWRWTSTWDIINGSIDGNQSLRHTDACAGAQDDPHQFHFYYHLLKEQVDVFKHYITPRVDKSKGVQASLNINDHLLTTKIESICECNRWSKCCRWWC